MPLDVGSRLGAFEILASLGVGGMGEVYKARDTRLDRLVAIKVLPETHAADAQARERFEREAKAVAALSHPNIVTLYSVEEAGGVHFLAMELVEGTTLSEVIPSHGLRLDRFFELAIPIVDAIVGAHDRGITHRDLKPANVMVMADSRVKVLDFGLAKLAAVGGALADMPTIALTGHGRIVGTVTYMSPEQAEGRAVDHRSDIFSLGVIFYEMLTGRPPFRGDTPISTISAIIKDTPESISDVNPAIPRELARVIRRTLAKDPEDRYQSAKDLRNELRTIRQELQSGELITAGTTGPTAARSRIRIWIPIAAAVAGTLLVAAGATWIARLTTARTGPAAGPFSSIKLSRLTSTGKATVAAISPDGRYVVHVVRDRNQESLWIRQVATTSDVQIVPPGRISYFGLAFSPDGNYVYYVGYRENTGNASLMRVPALGGAPARVLNDIDSGVAISPDAQRLAFVRGRPRTAETAVVITSATGGDERAIAVRKTPDAFPMFVTPAWSPDGRSIAVAAGGGNVGPNIRGGERTTVAILDADRGSERIVTTRRWENVTGIAWTPDGRGLIVSAGSGSAFDNQLWLVMLDGATRRITNDLNNYTGASVAAATRAFVTTQASVISTLSVLEAANLRRATAMTSGNRQDGMLGVAWLGDGRLLFTSATNGTADLWIANADGSSQAALTNDAASEEAPCLTNNDRYVVFSSSRGGGSGIWRFGITDNSYKQLSNGNSEVMPVCSPDGRWVFYTSSEAPWGVFKVSPDGGAPVRMSSSYTWTQAISPDGTSLAGMDYAQGQQPNFALAVRSANDGALLKRIELPLTLRFTGQQFVVPPMSWSPDGQSIHYVRLQDGIGNIWSQPLAGTPAQQLTDFDAGEIFSFGWSRDGKRLAVARGTVSTDVVLITDQSKP